MGDFECKLLTRRRVDFNALLNILARGIDRDEDFGRIGGAEVAFELYRWMTNSVTGKHYGRWSWPTRWTRESLSMNMSSRVNCGAASGVEVTPFRCSYDTHQDAGPPWGWRRELASRFAHALLDDGKMAEWREAMGISFAKPKSVSILTYDRVPPPPRASRIGFDGEPRWLEWQDGPAEGRRFPGEIDRLFALATPTRRLRDQLNTFHPGARYLLAVKLWPTSEGWEAGIEYGFQGSSWSRDSRIKGWSKRDRARDKTHCAQRTREPFSNFIYRAHDQFESLLTPPCRVEQSCSHGDGFAAPRPPRAMPRWDFNMKYGGERCEVGP